MEKLLTIKEFAKREKVSKFTVYGWIARRPDWVSASIVYPVAGVQAIKASAKAPDRRRSWHRARERRIEDENISLK